MNVKELKAKLVDLPDDMEVIMQEDREGNSYSPLSIVDSCQIYVPDGFSGIAYAADWSAEDADCEKEEWDEIQKLPLCLVLVPIN